MEAIKQAATKASSISDVLGFVGWNRPRSTAELRIFVESRHASLPDDIDL